MGESELKILHTIASLKKSAGGPPRSVASLCNKIGMLGTKIHLLSVGNDLDPHDCVLPNSAYVSLHYSQELRIPLFGGLVFPRFVKQICDLNRYERFSVIHDHGLWLHSNYASAKAARKLDIPWIVSTRGMLEPWALKYKSWKKRPVWKAWQKGTLSRASIVHATSPKEADNLRGLGLQNPIAIIPNGVDLPRLSYEKNGKIKIALFLSRIHPVKGLLNLVEAWSQLRPSGWQMVIAGHNEENHLEVVRRAIENAGLLESFKLLEAVDDKIKWDLYKQADVFILPTFSENFGIVVAEALAAGVPVITTKGTPWQDLEKHFCGWWVDIGAKSLSTALSEAVGLSDEERSEMGKRGRNLIKEKYSWDKIALDMLKVYEWVQYGGYPPDCVRLY